MSGNSDFGRPFANSFAPLMSSTSPGCRFTRVSTISDLYQAAPTLEQQGIHVVSTDEMTGIHALERAAPTLPMQPGQPERREISIISA